MTEWPEMKPNPYDASNGTISGGDTVVIQGAADPASVMRLGMDNWENR